MVSAVCLQEWQSSLWGGTVLNYSIQIYTELSEIIGITYVNCDGVRQPVLKGVITIISSYFGYLLLDSLTGIHERFTLEWLGK